MKLLCMLKIIKCGVLSDSVWIVSLQKLEINHLGAVHVTSPSVCKITKNNTLSQVFCMFCNAAHTSKSQNI